jgi:hypothetical protein
MSQDAVMKTSLLLSAAAGLLLSGCGEKSDKPAQTTNAAVSSGGGVLTAPADYLGAAVKARQSAIKTVDVASLNKAIQLFNVQEGRNPKDLNELVQKKYIPEIPPVPYGTKIVYDANAGEVKIVKQ